MNYLNKYLLFSLFFASFQAFAGDYFGSDHVNDIFDNMRDPFGSMGGNHRRNYDSDSSSSSSSSNPDFSYSGHHRHRIPKTCEKFANYHDSCSSLHGIDKQRCKVCKENEHCRILNGNEEKLCKVYRERKSCFMTLNGRDKSWCEYLAEGKPCFMAFPFISDRRDKEKCEKGKIPKRHKFWSSH